MRVFFDTSALTKRYVEEVESEQVRALCAEADALAVSVLVVLELISILCRLVREGRLSSEDCRSLKSALQADLSDADLCDLSQDAFEQTIRCLENHPLRTLDAFMLGALSSTSRTSSSLQIAVKPRRPAVKGWPWWTSPCDAVWRRWASWCAAGGRSGRSRWERRRRGGSARQAGLVER